VEASAEESAADLAARSAAARDGIGPGEWVLWRLVADRVEFWQGSPDRRHLRTIYRRTDDGWQLTDPESETR
jgi:pyridoxamine 5'-phosphate oxidase